MKQFTFIAIFLCSLILGMPVKAQSFASTTDPVTGQMTYYRIFSAKDTYNNKCIEDNQYGTNNNKYKYLINDYISGDKSQAFQLVAVSGDTTKYYIKNLRSFRYLTNNTQLVANHYVYLNGWKSDASPFTITRIGSNQVLISATEDYDIVRYICAADSALAPEKLVMSETLGSSFAWYIVKATDDLTAIQHIMAGNNQEDVSVSVLGRNIVVAGTDKYSVFDITGKQLAPTGQRSTGLYIVHAAGKSFKVLVK